MIVDSHCHLYDEKITNKKEILENLKKDNQICICSADNFESALKCLSLAKQNDFVFATIGVHPHCANLFSVEVEKKFEQLAKTDKKIVAIGEIGLDYHYDFSPREVQKRVFEEQIKMADKLHLPCVFHIREATEDFLKIVEKNLKFFNNSGVVHSFSGSLQTAQYLIEIGFFLGFNGIITFSNANNILKVLKEIPLSKILIETDAPYLTPVPFRGRVNEPKNVLLVAKKIAEIKNISVEEVLNQTSKNALNLFKIEVK